MEETELENFSHHLEPAREAGLKSSIGAGIATSATILLMFGMYAYAFFVG
jgi:hypothetical protein